MPGVQRSRLQKMRRVPAVTNARDFKYQIRTFTRPSIIAEGDSWFEYPRKWGQHGNILDHIQAWTKGKANLYRLGSNGDEATEMLSAVQRHGLAKVLHETAVSGRPVDLLLFSAGGNDVVGEWDLERFLKPYRAGVPVEKLFHKNRLDQKVRQVELAYRELMAIRNHYSKDTVIITHTYDRVIPSDKGVQIGRVTLAGPWIKPALDAAGFPAGAVQRRAARYLLERLRTALCSLEGSSEARGLFRAVDTHGLVRENEWRNEIHPKPAGFERVAAKIYEQMRKEVPELPERR